MKNHIFIQLISCSMSHQYFFNWTETRLYFLNFNKYYRLFLINETINVLNVLIFWITKGKNISAMWMPCNIEKREHFENFNIVFTNENWNFRIIEDSMHLKFYRISLNFSVINNQFNLSTWNSKKVKNSAKIKTWVEFWKLDHKHVLTMF